MYFSGRKRKLILAKIIPVMQNSTEFRNKVLFFKDRQILCKQRLVVREHNYIFTCCVCSRYMLQCLRDPKKSMQNKCQPTSRRNNDSHQLLRVVCNVLVINSFKPRLTIKRYYKCIYFLFKSLSSHIIYSTHLTSVMMKPKTSL